MLSLAWGKTRQKTGACPKGLAERHPKTGERGQV